MILDQFVTSGRAKWGLQPSLVLPAAARLRGPGAGALERAARAVPAGGRRHQPAPGQLHDRGAVLPPAAPAGGAARARPAAAFVLTPKSLLRHPAVASTPRELAEGRFQSGHRRCGRARARRRRSSASCCAAARSTSTCSRSERRPTATDVAICRVEQLYPFPQVALREVLDGYPALREVVWLQEEPENMGAWEFMRPLLEELIGDRCPLRYIGRARSSSPSEGSRGVAPAESEGAGRAGVRSRTRTRPSRRWCCRRQVRSSHGSKP